MKRPVHFVLITICILSFTTSNYAAGLGIAFHSGFGQTTYNDFDADASQFGINFIFDTNVSKNNIFNYRLNFGIEFFNHDFTYEYSYYDYYYGMTFYDYYDGSFDGLRIVTDHTFGFGIVKSSVIRLWMGPNVRLGFIAGDNAGITLGGGLTILGLNFNMGSVFTLALEAGYMFDADIYFDSIYNEIYNYNAGSWFEYNEDSGLNNLFVAKLSFLFRIHDTYEDF